MNRQSNWDDLSRTIRDEVDRAVNSQDFQNMARNVRHVVETLLMSAARPSEGRPRPSDRGARPRRSGWRIFTEKPVERSSADWRKPSSAAHFRFFAALEHW